MYNPELLTELNGHKEHLGSQEGLRGGLIL